jgi:hypothetical protein
VSEPRQTLAHLSRFIEQELDYDQILRVGIGSVSAPNTSFGDRANFNPVGRWRAGFSEDELHVFESLVGSTLTENGYELATKNQNMRNRIDLRLLRASYQAYFETKLYLKAKTPLGRIFVTRDLSWV